MAENNERSGLEHTARTAACDAIDAVMESAHQTVLAEITADFAGYSEHDTMVLHDPYETTLPHDSIRSPLSPTGGGIPC